MSALRVGDRSSWAAIGDSGVGVFMGVHMAGDRLIVDMAIGNSRVVYSWAATWWGVIIVGGH